MGEGIVPNQAGILAQGSIIGRYVRRKIPGEVSDMRLAAYSEVPIMFSDISYSIKPIALGQDKITVH